MDNELLKKLRRKQFVIMNLFMLIAFGLMGIYFYLGYSRRGFWIGLSVIYFVLIIKPKFIGGGYDSKVLWLPGLRPLIGYEKEKLGEEWNKIQARNWKAQILLLVISLLQAMLSVDRLPVSKNLMFIYPIFAISMMILINVSQYLHARKVDSGTNQSLQGYANWTLGFGIFVGIIFVGLTTGVVFILL